MSDAATALHHPAVEPAETPLTPESWGKLGMWIFLAGDAVGFGTLLAAYGAMRATSADWPNPYEVLGINLTALMTFLLICSSVTMVKALEWLQGATCRAQDVLLLTALGGAIFVGLQAYEWTHLIHRGLRHRQPVGRLAVRRDLLPDHRLPRPARHRRRDLPAGDPPGDQPRAGPAATTTWSRSSACTGTSSTSSGSWSSPSCTSCSGRAAEARSWRAHAEHTPELHGDLLVAGDPHRGGDRGRLPADRQDGDRRAPDLARRGEGGARRARTSCTSVSRRRRSATSR